MSHSRLQEEFGDSLAGTRVLVTGATGFIGYHLCEALVSLRAAVHGLARAANGECLPTGCQPLPVDLMDYDAVRATVKVLRPDVIYHLAGRVTADRDVALVLPMLEGNLIPAAHMLLAANDVGCERFVCAGSSEETDVAHPVASSPYAASKTAVSAYGQMFHRLYAVPVVVLRPFSVYGPRQGDDKLIPYAIRALLRGESPQLTGGDQVRDFIYVKDVARGFLEAGAADGIVGEALDLGTGLGTRVREVMTLLTDILGVDITPTLGAVPARVAEEDQIADPARTKELLGWEPRWSLREGLEETVKSYRTA